jgi:hypothetical protein
VALEAQKLVVEEAGAVEVGHSTSPTRIVSTLWCRVSVPVW